MNLIPLRLTYKDLIRIGNKESLLVRQLRVLIAPEIVLHV